jgi:DNA-binding transcriptional ArsR family regulator
VTVRAAPSVSSKASIFRGFADPSRLSIVEALRGGARTVSEICRATGLAQPNTSNHLACLLGCGLVRREPRGRFVHYRLADDRVEALLALGDEISAGVSEGGACCPVCGSETR